VGTRLGIHREVKRRFILLTAAIMLLVGWGGYKVKYSTKLTDLLQLTN
jgi:hypothetical protein